MSVHHQAVAGRLDDTESLPAAVESLSCVEHRRWKPPANHPWRQYRSVYMQKKRMDLIRQRQLAECV
jgi:ribonuclease D